MFKDDDRYNELAFYTLAHPDPAFIHQHAVDAYSAQNADESTKAIAVVFALIGLYLLVEKGYTGRQVQVAHMRLARSSKGWSTLPIPVERGEIRIEHVLEAEPGPVRDALIDQWCISVWRGWRESRPIIQAIAREHLGIN
ncbi:MAG TPA: DUF5946 family protein [Terracidiphilus sp.]|jgi:hypothetical protein|nr:DUF5946 family protein [Terracidiphilus sp.]